MKTAGLPEISLRAVFAHSSIVFGVRALGAAVTLAINVVIARETSVATYGVYLLVLAWSLLIAQFYTFGVDVVVLRFVPTYEARKQPERSSGLLMWAKNRLYKHAFPVLLLTPVALGLANYLGKSELLLPLIVAITMAITTGWISMYRAHLQGLALPWAYLPDQLIRPLVFSTAVIAMLWACRSALSESYLVLLALFSSLLALWVIHRWSGRYKPALKDGSDNSDKQQWSASTSLLFAIGLSQLVLGQMDLIALSILRTTTDTGLYGAVVRIISVFAFAFAALNAALTPRIGRLIAEKSFSKLRRSVGQLQLMTLMFSTLILIILWSAASDVLQIFGSPYNSDATITAFRILLVAQLSNALALSAGNVLLMAGLQQYLVKTSIASATTNICLNFILIPGFGLAGAAAATTVALILQNSLAMIRARQYLNEQSG